MCFARKEGWPRAAPLEVRVNGESLGHANVFQFRLGGVLTPVGIRKHDWTAVPVMFFGGTTTAGQ